MDVRAKRDGQDLYDFGTFTLDVSDRREDSAGIARRVQL